MRWLHGPPLISITSAVRGSNRELSDRLFATTLFRGLQQLARCAGAVASRASVLQLAECPGREVLCETHDAGCARLPRQSVQCWKSVPAGRATNLIASLMQCAGSGPLLFPGSCPLNCLSTAPPNPFDSNCKRKSFGLTSDNKKRRLEGDPAARCVS